MMNNFNNIESQQTQKFINCINSKNHDIGCECMICRSCRDDILLFYKNKRKKRYHSKSFDDTLIRSKPIPIPNSNNKENKISSNIIFNSLPNIYEKKYNYSINIINNKCIICNKIDNNKLINNFYHLCDDCYIFNEI